MTLKIFDAHDTETSAPRLSTGDRANDLLDRYVNAVKQDHQGKLNSKVKPKEYKAGRAILDAHPADQLAVTLAAASLLVKESLLDSQRDFALRELLKLLCRRELPYDPASTKQLFKLLEIDGLAVSMLPTGVIISSIEKHVKRCGLTPQIERGLERLARKYYPTAGVAEYRKLGVRIAAILEYEAAASTSVAFDLNTGEAWTNAMLVELGHLDDDQRSKWQALLEHCGTAKQSQPSKKWLKEAQQLLDAVADNVFITVLQPTLAAVGMPGKSQKHNHGGYVFGGHPTEIHDTHADTLRGLVWVTSLLDDPALVSHVGDAAEKCFQKVPEVGPRCPKVGNACLIALSSLQNFAAVAQLGRLKARAKHASTRKQISRALERAAENAGLTQADLEEIAVPTHGLVEVGTYTEQLGDFTARITADAHSKPAIAWFKQDGKIQKTVPAAVKSDYADELKAVKKKAKDISILMPSIRYRTEQLFLAERSWTFEEFRKRWLDHPLVGVLARRLIWKFEANGEIASAIWAEAGLESASGQLVNSVDDQSTVSIWHPMQANADEVLAWREYLEENQISQPFKQAHREIYVLTDAERETADYSNRFAAHIIRQHQFAALCQQRGWRYQLQGDWDSSNAPYLELPQYDLRAEFWVDPMEGFSEISQAFIYLHLSTDQVRFTKLGRHEPLPLDDVPPLVFSEVMRDVDLFVGVTSVGNDPNWGESGTGEIYHDYWEKYSFGDLSQTAETRRDVLQTVIPRLKIADRCRIDDRFLIVQGQIRTYKIHLGSGNVLMSPNDHYLCIVKMRDAGTKQTDNIYLPFEGDTTLSMILSKAFLLVEDDKIKDPTIAHQIAGVGVGG